MSRRHTRQPGGTPALNLLSRSGVAFAVHEFEHDPGAESFGLEAAQVLGVAPGRVFKTLVVQTDRSVDKGLVVAVVPVGAQLDLRALAREIDCKRAVLADSGVAERTTGYLVGGISPLGQKRALLTVVDASAAGHGTVLVSGGRRGLDVELAPADLVRLTSGRLAAVTR
ncbi:Cys-tRNA(Pro) deacylase [Flexivirga caeni]|uniref:Cys-tRNA(Pro)/Cys-tRNA(Cys) deacylase n=1 Tax=Flexivirga caeni TaxID=2294115 RepID=A0A3M9MJR7_9MICO|nr:Cys-tRNA(Pro) deacylase [Flexivirga caeni]RNI24898.1 Cys-tRNA(Pro) deacylase [Flexivirga caeni]